MSNFYEGRGTKFSVWYHFFGEVFYGYVYGEDLAWFTGAIEHVGSLIMGHFAPQMQKGAVNLTGGAIGSGIRNALKKGTYLKGPDNPAATDPTKYLNLTEDFRDRIEVVSDPEYRLMIGDGDIGLTSLQRSVKGCNMTVFTDEGFGISNGQTYHWQNVTLDQNKSVHFNVSTDVIGARAFLDGCTQ
jgi:hypothetical protein